MQIVTWQQELRLCVPKIEIHWRTGVWILWILWQPSHLRKFLLTAIKTDVKVRIRIFLLDVYTDMIRHVYCKLHWELMGIGSLHVCDCFWHVGPHVTVWRFKAWWWMAVDDGCKFLVVASLLLACPCYELRCPVGEYMPTSGASRCERCDAPMVTTQAYESKSDTVAPFCSKQVCFEQWRRQYHECTCMHLEAPVARRLAGL